MIFVCVCAVMRYICYFSVLPGSSKMVFPLFCKTLNWSTTGSVVLNQYFPTSSGFNNMKYLAMEEPHASLEVYLATQQVYDDV